MQTLKNIFSLIKICFNSKQGKKGFIYAFLVIGLNIGLIQINLAMITWNKDFYNSLEKYDLHGALTQIGVFILLTFLGAIMYLAAEYIRKVLVITWRKVLNDTILDHWLNNKVHWYLNNNKNSIDNPDQRIAEDCRLFFEKLTDDGFLLIIKIIGLFSYFSVLWQITNTFVLSFNLFDINISIPHYLIWLAPLYVLISSFITHWLGKPLKKLLIQQQHKEANYRFTLTRFRESKEPIALLNGEQVEKAILRQYFQEVIKNWHYLIKREFWLGCFTRPYNLSVFYIPTFLALPIYLVGKVSLGTLMQISKAFSNVAINLSWFIFKYNQLAELIACSHRLNQFIHQAEFLTQAHCRCAIPVTQQDQLIINHLVIKNPQGKVLFKLDKIELNHGESVVLSGVSGIGKSTLLKILAGIYPYFEGKVQLPNTSKLFLSQSAYFPIGGLAHAVAYPLPLVEKDLPEIKQILGEVGFNKEFIEQKLLDYDLTQLSGGEKQRLIIARVLMHKPAWVFMDETTNALDKESEYQLLQLLQTRLTTTSFIIISHSNVASYFKNCHQINL
ncbi:hypothetical protein A9G11_13815 [Gilliamella sp. wkB108]|uniref:ABC transporter ATP-binding protein/permease n=1 Tax=Gilliamella sp. wkB108 TaxID=3120256 RepID=UPI00080DFA04|nr:SbmA/BacA-like family transporter [Gilliamella apicola]OCG26565.1 hypothetical protein A9G11_13815 [Gilliamella apicola]